MSIARKVNGVWQNIAGTPTIDDDLSATSVNPVQNKVIYDALDDKQDTLIAGTNITIAADGKTISATGAGNNFIGTTAEWNALTDAQKAQYVSRDITDDYSGIAIDNVPTENSNNLVKSGGVYTEIETLISSLTSKASTTDVNNKHKVSQFTIDTSSWSEDTTSQSGTTLYKKTISLTHVYVDSPSVDIGSTGVLPTTAQQDAYGLLQYVTVDSAIPCLYLYASDIPTDSFYINVEGVD